MNISCVICQDLLLPSKEIVFSRCGHVFHSSCLLPWLVRSKTCPQCRKEVTENRIYKAYFTYSNSESTSDNVDSLLQGRIDSLQFQILMKDKNIKCYMSKNATLEKQNAGLRQEVRKVESEINQKNSAIHALKEQITYFKEKYGKYKVLAQKLSQKEKELEEFQCMHNTFSKGSLEDVRRMIEKTKDPDTLVTCISVMRKKFEERLDFWKNENSSLWRRINEFENRIENFRQSGDQRNSDKNSSNIQKVDVYSQTNTKRKTENQNTSSSPRTKTEVIKMNQEGTTSECPNIIKRAKLHLRSAQSCEKGPPGLTSLEDTRTHSQGVHHTHSTTRLRCYCSIVNDYWSIVNDYWSIVYMGFIGISIYRQWRNQL